MTLLLLEPACHQPTIKHYCILQQHDDRRCTVEMNATTFQCANKVLRRHYYNSMHATGGSRPLLIVVATRRNANEKCFGIWSRGFPLWWPVSTARGPKLPNTSTITTQHNKHSIAGGLQCMALPSTVEQDCHRSCITVYWTQRWERRRPRCFARRPCWEPPCYRRPAHMTHDRRCPGILFFSALQAQHTSSTAGPRCLHMQRTSALLFGLMASENIRLWPEPVGCLTLCNVHKCTNTNGRDGHDPAPVISRSIMMPTASTALQPQSRQKRAATLLGCG